MSNITAAPVTPVGALYNTNPSYSGTFIPTLWSAKLNAKFYAASTFADICNRDWEGDISNIGDKVIINEIPDLVIRDYVVGGNLQYDTPRGNTIELAVDRGKYFAFNVADVLEYQAKPELLNMFSTDAAEQMRIVIDSTCLFRTLLSSRVATANRGATAGRKSAAISLGVDTAPRVLSGSTVLDIIIGMASVLDEQNVPESGRWLLIDPTTRLALMTSNLAQAQFMGDDKSLVRSGLIGMIDRFKVYVTNQLPTKAASATLWTSGDGSETVTGGSYAGGRARLIAAGHTSALTFASQMAKTEQLRNPSDFGDLVRGMQIFGHQVAKGEAVTTAVVSAV